MIFCTKFTLYILSIVVKGHLKTQSIQFCVFFFLPFDPIIFSKFNIPLKVKQMCAQSSPIYQQTTKNHTTFTKANPCIAFLSPIWAVKKSWNSYEFLLLIGWIPVGCLLVVAVVVVIVGIVATANGWPAVSAILLSAYSWWHSCWW